MAEVLCVYREVKLIKEMAAARKEELSDAVAIVSYDEEPGIQAIATTAPDLPPEPGKHAAFARDHEYKRHGTVSLLAGIDLLTGQVHALVKDRHCSREFIEFLRLLDAGYPAHTAIKLILDNHSAHISKETKAWLANQPAGRFEFTFTPKHGSWLNLVENFFSKLARLRLLKLRNSPSDQSTAVNSGPIPFSCASIAAGAGHPSLTGLSKASRSASTAFNCGRTNSRRSSSRLICAFRCAGKGRPSPVLNFSSRARRLRFNGS